MKKFDSSSMEVRKIYDVEDAPLIPKSQWNVVLRRYQKSRKCVTSRYAIMVLIWSFFVSLIHVTIIRLGSYQVPVYLTTQYYLIAVSIFSALIKGAVAIGNHFFFKPA